MFRNQYGRKTEGGCRADDCADIVRIRDLVEREDDAALGDDVGDIRIGKRARFEQQFREMAAKIVSVQAEDGFWRSSLLDPAEYPAKEASGTGFFCYGLLWGLNHGLLDRATYLPPALKGWNALTTCVQPDGKLIHIQPIGADPKKFDENSTEPYGVGSFLLAGSELYLLRQR